MLSHYWTRLISLSLSHGSSLMPSHPLSRVVHLIPRDGLGGVESAVRSLDPNKHKDLAVLYMAGPSLRPVSRLFRTLSPDRGLWSPVAYWVALKELLRMRPKVLICSLWRASLVGIFAKILMPRTKLVVIVHATVISHFADKLVTSLACKMAEEVWCDSEASKVAVRELFGQEAKKISFRVAVDVKLKGRQRRRLDFVFWGRHAHVKRLPRAVRLFNRVLAQHPDARFYIYGGEGPATEEVLRAAGEATRPDRIQLMGIKPPAEYPEPIPSCTFFLMTSRTEGAALAVVEAMQLGLIPVVTPVGEIANYCVDGVNAILVEDDQIAADRIISLAEDGQRLLAMTMAAVETWNDVPDYSSDFAAAYRRVLGAHHVAPDA